MGNGLEEAISTICATSIEHKEMTEWASLGEDIFFMGFETVILKKLF